MKMRLKSMNYNCKTKLRLLILRALKEITDRYKYHMGDTEVLVVREQTLVDKIKELETTLEGISVDYYIHF